MAKITIEELHKLFLKHKSVSIDTRTLEIGDLFFALHGPNFDGNKYALQALDNGAEAVVVDNDELDGVQSGDKRYLLVDDTLDALQALASFHRDQSNAKVIGITGSNGKTTTKELIAEVLCTQYNIIYTKGNLNNHIGVPLTLLTITDSTEIAIVEMGANHVGEIAELSSIAKPDFGIITNIGNAHIEGFGSLEGVKTGKSELYKFVKKNGGHLFVNSSDPVLLELVEGYDSVTYYSQSDSFNGTSVQIDEIEGSLEISLEWKEAIYKERTNLYGEFNVSNILAGLNIGFHFSVPIPKAIIALANYIPQNSRSQRIQTKENEIYLDAYNANPTSMDHALKAFAKVDALNKVVVLGDMFELGNESDAFHQNIVDLADELFNRVIYLGAHFNKTKTKNLKFINTDAYKNHLSENSLVGSIILLKGSRGMALEKLVDEL